MKLYERRVIYRQFCHLLVVREELPSSEVIITAFIIGDPLFSKARLGEKRVFYYMMWFVQFSPQKRTITFKPQKVAIKHFLVTKDTMQI